MDALILLITLLPVVFMVHDFEEIILFKFWISKNRTYLSNRFPAMSKSFLPRFEKLSTAGFALAVAEEFVLISLITYGSIFFNSYYLWLATFMGFFVHLIIHLIQWIVIRKYLPLIVTTVIALTYCIYTLTSLVNKGLFNVLEILICTLIGAILVGLNVLIAHKLGEKFDNWTKDSEKYFNK